MKVHAHGIGAFFILAHILQNELLSRTRFLFVRVIGIGDECLTPLIFGQIRLMLILAVIGGLQNDTNILILTQGGPGTASMVPGLYLYDQAVQYFNFGYACAIGVILFVIILAFTILNMRYARSSVEYEASS